MDYIIALVTVLMLGYVAAVGGGVDTRRGLGAATFYGAGVIVLVLVTAAVINFLFSHSRL